MIPRSLLWGALFFPFFFLTFSYCQAIEIDKNIIDLGSFKEGIIIEQTLNIKNTSKNILNIGVRPSCNCITVTPEKYNLKQNQNINIKVKVNTAGYTSNINEKIFIQSNDSKNPYISIDVKGKLVSNKNLTIPITIFDSVGCLFCIELEKNTIPLYEKKYNVKIELTKYPVSDPKNYSSLVLLEKKMGKTLNKIPVLFIGNDIIGGKEEIKKNLSFLIEKYIKLGGAKKIDIPSGEVKKSDVTSKLSLLPIVSAGLIDSVNPCAFATIIFLITYLNMVLKKQKYEILLTGMSFVVGVFVTYFLIGLGLLKFLQQINQILIISKIMYLLIGVLVLFVSFQHLREAIAIKKGTNIYDNTIKLKLPNKLRWIIYTVITKLAALKYLIPIAFLIGAAITILELFCTGQIYLPTIMYIIKLPNYHTQGILYLLLYCLLFVLPLIIIFFLFYYGLDIDLLEAAFRKKIFLIKILMSAFFLTLGIIIFIITFFT
ncbi:MAG: DUF1573 domain-containing protein [Elusimicrobia bacterium]|nr:DUF1573 domain-containing protein [Elusimicrobiota bacterium]